MVPPGELIAPPAPGYVRVATEDSVDYVDPVSPDCVVDSDDSADPAEPLAGTSVSPQPGSSTNHPSDPLSSPSDSSDEVDPAMDADLFENLQPVIRLERVASPTVHTKTGDDELCISDSESYTNHDSDFAAKMQDFARRMQELSSPPSSTTEHESASSPEKSGSEPASAENSPEQHADKSAETSSGKESSPEQYAPSSHDLSFRHKPARVTPRYTPTRPTRVQTRQHVKATQEQLTAPLPMSGRFPKRGQHPGTNAKGKHHVKSSTVPSNVGTARKSPPLTRKRAAQRSSSESRLSEEESRCAKDTFKKSKRFFGDSMGKPKKK